MAFVSELRLSLEHSQRFGIYKQPPFRLLMDEPSLSLHSSCGLVEPCCLSHSILEFHNRSDTITLALPHCHYTHTHTLLTLFLPGWALTEGKGDIFKVTHSNPVPLTHTRLTTETRLMRGNDTSAFSRNNTQP